MQALKRCCFKEKVSQASKAPKTISIVIGFFFFINYIVGVGFLSIPAVFSKAGFLTAVLTLLAISLLAWTTITWLVEAMARAQVGYVQLLHVSLYVHEHLRPSNVKLSRRLVDVSAM